MKHKVFAQDWEESERGWGVRPDGVTLHLSLKDVEEHIKAHWDYLPPEVPEEYSRPAGKPYEIEIDGVLYDTLAKRTDKPPKKAMYVRQVLKEQDKKGFSKWRVVR